MRKRLLAITSAACETELGSLMVLLVDALLAADTTSLEAVVDPLRDALARLQTADVAAAEARGYLTACLALIRCTLNRLPSVDELALRQNSHSLNFLLSLRGPTSRSSRELREIMRVSASELSRVGRGLRARGLVVQRRAGRVAIWELSPRGRQLTRLWPD
jgi:hypothetical protein